MPDTTPIIAPEEIAARAALRVAGDMPGEYGRLRVARIIMGTVRIGVYDPASELRLEAYAAPGLDAWPIKAAVAIIDALIDGGLIAQTKGQRPTLVLTRAGHRALDALDELDAKAAAS